MGLRCLLQGLLEGLEFLHRKCPAAAQYVEWWNLTALCGGDGGPEYLVGSMYVDTGEGTRTGLNT